MMEKSMPENFLWGVSSSAFQIEGAYKQDGKGLSTVDTRKVKKGLATTETASDHYNHWQEDVELLVELGVKSYRFSISWPRIFPNGDGEKNQKGIDFYHKLIDELVQNGIEPLVTIYHFDLPQSLVDRYNGWLGRETIEAYSKYAKTLFEEYGTKVKHWISINEELMVMHSRDFNGIRSLNDKEYKKASFQMMHNMSVAESKVFKLCHEMVVGGKIGPASAFQSVYPVNNDAKNIQAAMDAEELLSYTLLDLSVKGTYPKRVWNYLVEENMCPDIFSGDLEILKSGFPDYICLNYYFSISAESYTGLSDDDMPPFFQSNLFRIVASDNQTNSSWMAFGTDPLGLKIALRKVHDRYQLPLMITENGFADYDLKESDNRIHDTNRINYLYQHIEQCYQACQDGIELMGYSPWSFIDSLSGRQGFEKRYGLVYIDRTDDSLKTLNRHKKDSYYWYKNVIESNSLNDNI